LQFLPLLIAHRLFSFLGFDRLKIREVWKAYMAQAISTGIPCFYHQLRGLFTRWC